MNWLIGLLIVGGLTLVGLYFFERSRPKIQSNVRLYGEGRTVTSQNRDFARAASGQEPVAEDFEVQHGELRTMADSTKGDYTAAQADQHVEYDEVQERAVHTPEEDDQPSAGVHGR